MLLDCVSSFLSVLFLLQNLNQNISLHFVVMSLSLFWFVAVSQTFLIYDALAGFEKYQPGIL